MASDLKNNEEGMADILTANEGLLRVTDTYKLIFESSNDSTTNGTTVETPPPSMSASTTQEANSTPGGEVSSAAGGGTEGGDVLIDLAGLDFGPPPTPVIGGATQDPANLSSLINDFGLLGIETDCYMYV